MFIRLYTESSTSSSSRSSKLSRGQRKGNRLFFPAPVARSKFRLLNLLCPKILASTLSRFLRKRKRDSCDHRYFVPNFREIRCFLCTVDFCDDERRKTYRHTTTKKPRRLTDKDTVFVCRTPLRNGLVDRGRSSLEPPRKKGVEVRRQVDQHRRGANKTAIFS